MSNTLHVKKGDTVKVIAGDKVDKKVGRVLQVIPGKSAVVVEGVNIATKHKKARSAKDTGGRIKMEMPIHASNVMVVCPDCNNATRIAHKMVEDGEKTRKVRVCKKCGATLDQKVESVKAKRDKKEKERAARKEKKAKKDKETAKLVDADPSDAPAAEKPAKKAPAKAKAAPAETAEGAAESAEKPAKKAPAKKAVKEETPAEDGGQAE